MHRASHIDESRLLGGGLGDRLILIERPVGLGAEALATQQPVAAIAPFPNRLAMPSGGMDKRPRPSRAPPDSATAQ
ncbi:hypothetical protein [Leptolyngbya iicbica]|uniref:Uncharacterized protein n=2 Tax=Cyanophyceae TaxID=3028117 RepID=A0A4Q7EFT9_9CYAN|nr:hypothetical protein [Leptolyngbya sp. LK]RZM81947.1 hypothetical protein DYY88_01345 [Leptolyngbya sp. LK]